jgi:hypothetical protein
VELVKKEGKLNNVDPQAMINLIDCEDTTWNPTQQSNSVYKPGNRWGFPAGTREKSYGLAQIHLPDHKDISYEQATNPEFAIDFIAENWNKVTWSCK